LTPPWRVAVQHLDQNRHPNELWLEVVAEPGASFPSYVQSLLQIGLTMLPSFLVGMGGA
jgi:hypothetical protein